MPQKLPPLGCLTGSLGPNAERYAKPLEKLCDSLDPLLQGKSMDALGLSNHELNERVVTMKQQLHCLETTFNDQLRTQQEARTSEAKSFQMARAAYLEKLEMLKQTAIESPKESALKPIESPKESAAEQRAKLNIKIAKLTKQLEHRAQEDRNMKAELEHLKAVLTSAEGRNEMLSSKLEEKVKLHQSLEEKLQASQRELDATTKRFASAREAHQAKLRKVMQEAKESQCRAEHWEAQAKRVCAQSGETWKSTQELWTLKEEIQRLKQDLDHAKGDTESGATSAAQLRNDLQASMDTQRLLRAELDKMKAEVERSPKKEHTSASALPELEDHTKFKAEKAVQTATLPGEYSKVTAPEVEAAARPLPKQGSEQSSRRSDSSIIKEQMQNLRSSSSTAPTEKSSHRDPFTGDDFKKDYGSGGLSEDELNKILKEAENLAEEPDGIENIWDKLQGNVGAEIWSKIGMSLEKHKDSFGRLVQEDGFSEPSFRGLSQEEPHNMYKATEKFAEEPGAMEQVWEKSQGENNTETRPKMGKKLGNHKNRYGQLVEEDGCSEPSSRGISQEELDKIFKAAEKLTEEPGGVEEVWQKLQGELDAETWSKIGNELEKRKNTHGRLVEGDGYSEPSARGISQEELDNMCKAAEKLAEEPGEIEQVWEKLEGELGAETWSRIGKELEKHKDRMQSLAHPAGSSAFLREEVESYKCTGDSVDSREWRIGKRHKEYRLRRQLERIRKELEKHENRHGQCADEDGWSDSSPLDSEFLDSLAHTDGSSGLLREELNKTSDSHKCENTQEDLGDSREWRIGKRHTEYRKRRQLQRMSSERSGDSGGEEKRFEKVLEILENVLEVLQREL